MPHNRRDFLRTASLTAGALTTEAFLPPTFLATDAQLARAAEAERRGQHFNMCGFRAPALPEVRVGVVGLGMRGPGAVTRLSKIQGVTIKALCDKDLKRAEKAQAILTKVGLPEAVLYSGEEGWKAMCDRNDLDLVYICTPWRLHTPIALRAMRAGKHAATEVPAAVTLDECWELVETSERTQRHCMMLENCCYDFFEMLTLQMARQGLFGELVHAEGAYIHDLRDLNFSKTGYADMWRLRENATRNGNLYPTHGLGPIAQCLNINRGDQMEHLVSMSTHDFTMGALATEKAKADAFYQSYTSAHYRGNMNTTLIKTQLGKTIMLQHDVSSVRPYSRIHVLSGTKGVASKWPSPERIAFGHEWVKEDALKALYDQHTPPLIRHIGEMAKKVGGHGGMDFVMDWRLIDCLRNGLPLDQDVYDAALWSAVAPLSERSVAKRSRTVDIPDFTRGAWRTNAPVDLALKEGANTSLRG